MKRRVAGLTMAVALLGMTFGMLGCGGNQSSDKDSKTTEQTGQKETENSGDDKSSDKLNIAYFGPHQDNEYQISLREAVEAAGEEQGVNIKVYIADNDPAKQVDQIEQALTEGVDGIVIDPTSNEGIKTAVLAAKEAGVPFVTIHESVSNQEDCTAFVGSDLETGGKLKMEQVMKDFPDGGKFAVLYGPLGHTAQIQITDGYKKALEGQEDKYEYVFEGEGNWNAEDALDLASNWLSTGKQIDAFICNNDGMAIGALQAVKSAGKSDEILIYGLDAQQDVLQEVKNGTIRATIFNDYFNEAYVGLETCIKAINGETVEPSIMISPIVVTIDNVDEYLK